MSFILFIVFYNFIWVRNGKFLKNNYFIIGINKVVIFNVDVGKFFFVSSIINW